MSQRVRLAGIFLFSFVFIFSINIFYGIGLLTGDEMWAATSALGNPLDSIVFTLRFDLHPPVYYSIIDIWAVISKSDLWLRTSSMVTHSALVMSVYYIAGKLHGDKVAVTASLLALVSPLLLEYSSQLRMYSLISLLSVWIFYYTCKINEEGFGNKRGFLLVSLELLLVFTHAIGILFVFFHFMYGVLLNDPRNRRDFVFKWSLFHALVFCLSVPVILNSWMRSVEHAIAPDLGNILNTIAMINIRMFGVGPVVSFAISIAVLLGLLYFRKTRVLAFCYIVLPIIIFSLISYTVKPLWLVRNFSFAIPMIAIAQSIALHNIFDLVKRGKIFLYVCLAIIMSGHLSVYFQYVSNKKDGPEFSRLSSYLKNATENHKKTCVVSTNTLHTFWALLRYNVAVEWGHPLIIQPPLTDKWKKIISKIPSGLIQSLHLMPVQNYYEGKNLIIASGWSERCRADDVDQVFIVDDHNMIDKIDIKSSRVETFGPYTVYQAINRK